MDSKFAIKYLMSKANNALVKQIQTHEGHPYAKLVNEENLVQLIGSNEVNAWQHAYIAGALTIKGTSKQIASMFGYTKEFLTFFESLRYPKDTLRDIYNNARGIETAKNYKNTTDFARALFEKQYNTDLDKVIGTLKEYPPYLIVDPEDDIRTNASIIIDDIKETIKDYSIHSLILGCPWIFTIFQQATMAPRTGVDPILIDLNGDGIKTTSIEDRVYFDHQKDGFAESSAWVDENDGILAIDKNGDGVINDGGEIFGDNYVKANGQKATSGFDALKDLDSNNDGIISNLDEEFGNIKILKGDGSLISLEEAGIVSINLNSTAKNTVDENGNTLISSGTFVKSDGSVGNLGDFNLVVDKMNSFATEWLDESEDIAALPEVLGSGTVYSLHQAMVRDKSGVLKGLVEEFISAAGNVAKKNILLQILYKWTGADLVVDGSRGSNFNAKKLHVLEQFIGKGFIGTNGSNPHAQAAPILNNAFNSLMNNIYASLMSQTELKDVFNKLEIVYDTDTETVSYDLSKVREYIDNSIVEDEITGKNLLADFTQSFINLGLKDNSNYGEYHNYYVSMGDDYIDTCDFDYYLNYGLDRNKKCCFNKDLKAA